MARTFKDRTDFRLRGMIDADNRELKRQHYGNVLRYSMRHYINARTIERKARWFAVVDRVGRKIGGLD